MPAAVAVHSVLEGVRPWGNPWGAVQFGSSFFTGFHGTPALISGMMTLIASSPNDCREHVARQYFRGEFGCLSDLTLTQPWPWIQQTSLWLG